MTFKNFLFFIIVLIFVLTGKISRAQVSETAGSLEEINQQIKSKQEQIKEIELKLDLYKKNIEIKEKEAFSLRNQLSVLASRLAKAELELLSIKTKISELDLIIKSLAEEISLKEKKIMEQKKLLAGLINSFYLTSPNNYLAVILTNQSFADYFDERQYLEDLSIKIDQSLKNIKKDRQELAARKAKRQDDLRLVENFKNQLEQQRLFLEEEKQSREILLKETKSSELKFKLLVAQLRAENDSLNNEVSLLQREIEKKLLGRGLPGGVLTWPADADNGISTRFHDPTYPFRYLFEHSGLDIRLAQGTPVKASASGYVAWARSSRFYGNNVMIVHANNLVTLYAHLSRFNVSPDTFVAAGQVIGWSGGIPGTPGAGFSTGPHLHFEVRVNGAPQDPLAYVSRSVASR